MIGGISGAVDSGRGSPFITLSARAKVSLKGMAADLALAASIISARSASEKSADSFSGDISFFFLPKPNIAPLFAAVFRGVVISDAGLV